MSGHLGDFDAVTNAMADDLERLGNDEALWSEWWDRAKARHFMVLDRVVEYRIVPEGRAGVAEAAAAMLPRIPPSAEEAAGIPEHGRWKVVPDDDEGPTVFWA